MDGEDMNIMAAIEKLTKENEELKKHIFIHCDLHRGIVMDDMFTEGKCYGYYQGRGKGRLCSRCKQCLIQAQNQEANHGN